VAVDLTRRRDRKAAVEAITPAGFKSRGGMGPLPETRPASASNSCFRSNSGIGSEKLQHGDARRDLTGHRSRADCTRDHSG
jgi:hypothetical protein